MPRLLLALLLTTGCASTQPSLWNGLEPGRSEAGLRTVSLTSPPHLLQVSMWYPAVGGGSRLTYGDLFLLTLTELTATSPDRRETELAVAEYVDLMVGNGVPRDAATELMAQRMYARLDARAEEGRHPLVMITQGNGHAAVHQSVLAEYLASHGYVVATIPSITRLTGPLRSEDDLQEKVSAEASNLQRVFAALTTLGTVDRSRVAVIGHSLGARSALLFAERQPVAAIVSLDGGIGTSRGVETMPRARRDLPPILHLYEERDERMKPDFTFLRSLPTRDLRLEKLESLQHIHFSSMGFAAARFPEIATATRAGEGVREDVRAVAEKVRQFLDEMLK